MMIQHGHKNKNNVVIASKHVACPWLYPSYFPAQQSWLAALSEVYVHHTVCAHDRLTGRQTQEWLLDSKAYFHPHRDFGVFRLSRDASALVHAEEEEHHRRPTGLELDQRTLSLGDDLFFHGYTLKTKSPASKNQDKQDHRHQAKYSDAKSSSSNSSSMAMSPELRQAQVELERHMISGRFTVLTQQRQALASSDVILSQGMCGGSVTRMNQRECVGMIEGIVPSEQDAVELRPVANQAVFVPAVDIEHFLADLDEQQEHDGEAFVHEPVIFGTGDLEYSTSHVWNNEM